MNLRSTLKNCAWAVIPALLLMFAQWFANTMTQKDVALNYKISTRVVSGLHTAYIELSNHSEVAIDKVIISSNPPDVIQSSYDPLTNGKGSNTWEGEILAGQQLKILYILNKEMPTSTSALNSLLTAEYRKRNKENGRLEWSKVNLSEDGVILPGTIVYLLWYFSPIFASLLIIIGIHYSGKCFRQGH